MKYVSGAKVFGCWTVERVIREDRCVTICEIRRMKGRKREKRVPLRYNNDKRKKPLFSRGLSVCRHLFNSFSKLKCDEKIIEKRRLFH